MDFLIITNDKNATSEEVYHPLIDVAKLMGEKAYLYPVKGSVGIYHEFHIGTFENDSSDLIVNIPVPESMDEMKLVVNEVSQFYEPAVDCHFDVKRLALIACDNDELIYRFCRVYLKLRKDHKISFESRCDKLFDFSNIAKIEYQPNWYDKYDSKA